jgi:hypothetical protein
MWRGRNGFLILGGAPPDVTVVTPEHGPTAILEGSTGLRAAAGEDL